MICKTHRMLDHRSIQCADLAASATFWLIGFVCDPDGNNVEAVGHDTE
jgi:hypothetical protein